MTPVLFILFTIFASLLLNTVLARFALQHNWCDHPGNAKIHRQPVPFTGGIGILLTWAGTLLILSIFFPTVPVLRLLIPATIALLVGTCDDFYWKQRTVPGIKFLLQIVLALFISFLFITHNQLSLPASLFTIFFNIAYILLALNAFNLADGLDGLAGGEALISFLGLATIYGVLGRAEIFLPLLLLTATLTGFLVLNLQRPSRLFLGDGGSHLLGATFATFALLSFNPPSAPRFFSSIDIWTALALLLLLGAPLVDLIWVTLRRLYLRQPLFHADRNHLYDLLAATSLGPRRTVLVFWFGHALLVLTGVTMLLLEV
ncbi:undecaprenyl/decaprenyl-phosphate alpha-N-acetylglucosaminyl 1-phosphate transferase [candidate division WOR-3 bacterium]|nr:undecaprenyl/decaprenyl-phosphate alpha-N-acetylglucosaminyl 1-phosphate transferase [candidate division WOR-3 bacterium]